MNSNRNSKSWLPLGVYPHHFSLLYSNVALILPRLHFHLKPKLARPNVEMQINFEEHEENFEGETLLLLLIRMESLSDGRGPEKVKKRPKHRYGYDQCGGWSEFPGIQQQTRSFIFLSSSCHTDKSTH